ncbi:ribosomal-protein-alanine N-acetyltransferase [Paenibacillus taihuensis]|uniref:Ribosomal-protein-alanine N-acetyltransferase n=1 Tax=Paenibacillus taihuensis TaxID=1156355 RepID=A0A3D9S529_9BACL|nr:GNAT family N-acetyltransferase [Paenibacillus taihuensis]REE84406.1 ribosomal-protein-alanine N-acetyltransferase [Paenibacillus taihuensis]
METTEFNKTLESSRLILRRITLDDAEDIFDYAVDAQVSKYTSWEQHRAIEDTHSFIHFTMQKYENNQPSDWGIIEKKTNKLIGACGWVYINENHGRAEIGYVLSRKYWNQGYMSEVVNQILGFGFGELDLNRIEARCFAENTASERVMQKTGMQYEGLLREQMIVKGRKVDIKMYSILKRELPITE